MSVRKVVLIDEDKCTGCGECVPACAEGAIEIIDGVAKLRADNLCDGLGACLGDCPEGAITIEEREADDFDESAVEEHLKTQDKAPPSQPAHGHGLVMGHGHGHGHGGCPGARTIQFDESQASSSDDTPGTIGSELRQWPIQLHLVPPTAPYFENADVLLAADCVAFSLGDFHRKHLKGKALAVACPKLDQGQEAYLAKLVSMIDDANINTLTVMVMEVPCCGGLIQLAKEASSRANRKVPVKQVRIGLRGDVLSEDWV